MPRGSEPFSRFTTQSDEFDDSPPMDADEYVWSLLVGLVGDADAIPNLDWIWDRGQRDLIQDQLALALLQPTGSA
jgi:hypothetical protein